MKIYKRSILSSVTIWPCFISALTLAGLILSVIFLPMERTLLLVIPFIPPTLLLATGASAFFFVELTDHELILRNIVYRFWHQAYPFRTITRIRLKHSGGLTQTRLQIIRGEKKSWSYVIDLVSPGDYKMLIEDLRKQGIDVEVSPNITSSHR